MFWSQSQKQNKASLSNPKKNRTYLYTMNRTSKIYSSTTMTTCWIDLLNKTHLRWSKSMVRKVFWLSLSPITSSLLSQILWATWKIETQDPSLEPTSVRTNKSTVCFPKYWNKIENATISILAIVLGVKTVMKTS